MRSLALVSTLLCLFTLQVPVAWAQGWSVLEYDENGRVIGTREGTTGEEGGPAGTNDIDTRAVEPGELLLVDPSERDLQVLRAEGFRVLRSDTLEGLEFTLVQIATPDGMSLPEALQFIERRLPNLMTGTNDLLDLSRDQHVETAPYRSRQIAQFQDFTRNLSGWGTVPESCGSGIVLGQIDGVVDVEHRALRGKRLVYDSFLKDGRVPAAEDHGTAVAIMLIGRSVNGRPPGLLPGAKLYAANIFEQRDGKSVGNLAALVRAVDWLVQNGVRVANLSIAGQENQVMRLAIKRAKHKGLLLVAAAGNNGPNAPPAWPAADPDSFAVTAIDQSMKLYRHANQGSYIDFAAPGVNVPTQTPSGDVKQSGTSFAAPFITAMVAIHLQAGFDADPDLIRRSLQRYATDLGSTGKDTVFGWGLVRLKPSC